MKNTCYPCQNLKRLELSRQIFGRYSNVKFYQNALSGSLVVLCGRMGRQTKIHVTAKSRFSKFNERAKKK